MSATDTFTPTPDQKIALDAIVQFPSSGNKLLTIAGFAGTGKSRLTAESIRIIKSQSAKIRIACAAYTGKATDVMRRKLEDAGAAGDIESTSTIHSLIYKAITDDAGNLIEFVRVPKIDADLIIIDEASMVNAELWRDLISYGKPIIAVGDHGQLPPVQGNFNLMEHPQIKLEKIHRQAEGDAIIHVSMLARTNGFIPFGRYSDSVVKVAGNGPLEAMIRATPNPRDVAWLCGYNKFRVDANTLMRKIDGAQTVKPMSGERVICLRNNKDNGLFNGMVGTIDWIGPAGKHAYDARIALDGGTFYKGKISSAQFGKEQTIKEKIPGSSWEKPVCLFDFATFLTVWKSQGSEFERVVLFEQRNSYMTDSDWAKFLYTGVTRARKELTIVGGSY